MYVDPSGYKEVVEAFYIGSKEDENTAEKVVSDSESSKRNIFEYNGKLGAGLAVKGKLFGIGTEIGAARYWEHLNSQEPINTIEFNANIGFTNRFFFGVTIQKSMTSRGVPIEDSQVVFLGLKIGRYELGFGDLPNSKDIKGSTKIGVLTPLGGYEANLITNFSEIYRQIFKN